MASDAPAPPGGMRSGIALWGVFACIAIALRGARWDEDYEFAQVMLGVITYPEGHPLPYHLARLHTLQLDGLALLMRIFEGELFPNFFRNWLTLMASVVPPFWITARLARSTLAGHAMAALFLFGIHAGFFSNYPVQTWPGLYTNGHIGTAWAVLSVAMLGLGPLRAGHAMAAAMPLIHAGQWPPVLLFQGLVLLYHLRERDWVLVRWALSCLAVAGAMGLIWITFRPTLFPALPHPLPALAASEAMALMRNYMAHHATHRSMPGDMAFLAMAMSVVVAMMARAICQGSNIPLGPPSKGDKEPTIYVAHAGHFPKSPLEGGARRAGDVDLFATYLKLIVLIVTAIWITHLVLRETIPAPLVAWMPYRLINHLMPLALPLCAAAIGQKSLRNLHVLLSIALAAVIVPWLFQGPFPNIYGQYFADGIHIAFFLLGAGCASMPVPASRLLAAGMAVLLAVLHQYGAACFVMGILLVHMQESRRTAKQEDVTRLSQRRWDTTYPLAACVLLALAVLLNIAHTTAAPRRGTDIETIRAMLADTDDDSSKFVLVPPQQESLQAQLDQAVSTDMATITWIPYQPALVTSMQPMYEDLYGIELTPIPGLPQPSWIDHWQELSVSGWGLRCDHYGITHIIAPAWVTLHLDPVYKGEECSLYRVPGAGLR